MNAAVANESKVVYWHRELPPLRAEAMGEHTLDAISDRVPHTIAHRDELWDHCRTELERRANCRFEQEVARLGGRYAHVLSEVIEPQHDDATDEMWLHGRYIYVLYG